MFKAVPKEGPRAPLFYSGILLLCCVSATSAQDVSQADLERCASLATADARLACFESLASGGDDEPVQAPASVPPVEAAAETVPASSASIGDVAAEESVPTNAAAGSAVTATADPEPDSAAEPAPSRQAGIPEDFGMPVEDEYVEETITATVVNVETGRNRVLYFHFENGQVWRQIEGRRFSYPKNRAFDVEITTGIMGDHRLRLASGGAMTRIRRLR